MYTCDAFPSNLSTRVVARAICYSNAIADFESYIWRGTGIQVRSNSTGGFSILAGEYRILSCVEPGSIILSCPSFSDYGLGPESENAAFLPPVYGPANCSWVNRNYVERDNATTPDTNVIAFAMYAICAVRTNASRFSYNSILTFPFSSDHNSNF